MTSRSQIQRKSGLGLWTTVPLADLVGTLTGMTRRFELADQPFTRSTAAAAGVPPHLLRSSRFVQPFRGVYVSAELTLTRPMLLHAALMVLPADASVSHHTGLELWGADVGPPWPLHFSTNTTAQSRRKGIVLHRRRGTLHPTERHGIRVLGPDRCFIDAATTLPYVRAIVAGDQLIHLGCTNTDTLRDYADSVHLDGVRRARLRTRLVRADVESPRETVIRLMLVFARLPCPEPNVWIGTADERLARGDLVYLSYRIVIEYDGRWHDDTPSQDAYDELRRVALERAGWTVIVIKAAHLRQPREVVERVHRALVERGFTGRPPVFNAMWRSCFE